MLYFENDYCEGAHPAILRRLMETNLEKQPGYGHDAYCDSAKEKILSACGCPEGDVYFLVGGTQTNATVIASLLRRYEGVIAAATGHIAAHEAGAIEFTGHKVLTLPQHDGKLDAGEVEQYLVDYYHDGSYDHMVFPGMVYISHPTEYGTLYSLRELEALSDVCARYHLPLFLDGARLGYGLVSPGTDVTLRDIARLTTVFYIGGTKVGALCGEAVVFPKGAPEHFFTMVKQQGALLARPAAGHTVRHAVYGRSVCQHQPQRHSGGGTSPGDPAGQGLPLLYGNAHQPNFRHSGKRGNEAAGRKGEVQLLGKAGRRTHGGALRHQLGHGLERDRRTGKAAVIRHEKQRGLCGRAVFYGAKQYQSNIFL